jgi:ribonuclease J
MLFRPSMMRDVEEAGCLGGSHLICSVWDGYLENVKYKPFLEWLSRHGIPLDKCHTSGHASVSDLAKLRKAFQNAPLVPIHTDQPGRFEEVFGGVQQRADGEWWKVTDGR